MDGSLDSALSVLQEFWRAPLRGLPKYMQLREGLLQAIANGHWKPGAKLPTETELARHTPFSLGTVQRALRVLADDGVIIRQQGSGTYVAPNRKPMDEPWHCRFVGDDGTSFLPVYPHVIGRQRIRGQGPWSAHLGGIDHIRIDRVIEIGDEFSIYSRFYLEAERFADILAKPLAELHGKNLKAIISREFGLPVTHVSQTLATIRFEDAIRRALKLRHVRDGNLLEIGARAGRDRPVYFQELFIPPNTRKLLVSDSCETRAV